MEPTIDKSALIADLIDAIQELEHAPVGDRRNELADIVAQGSYNLLFKGRTAAQCVTLIQNLRDAGLI